jgi:hypothetical protein
MKLVPALHRIAAWPLVPSHRGGAHAAPRAGQRRAAHESTDVPLAVEPVVGLAAVPELVCCVYCGLPIRFVAGHGWVHVDPPQGTFGCRDEYGLTIDGQFATPPPGTPAAGTVTPDVASPPPVCGATSGLHLPAPCEMSSPGIAAPAPASGTGASDASPTRPCPSVPAELVEAMWLPGDGDAA